jgi:hypothetical protein
VVAAHFAALLLLGAGTAAFAVPAPSFRTTRVSLDTIPAGQSTRVSFAFTNKTADTLVVEQVQTGCGCLVAPDSSRLYAPGDSGAVVLDLRASLLSGPDHEVAVTFRAAADTFARNPAAVVLSIHAPVREELRFTPPVLSALHRGRGEFTAINGEVTNTSSRPLRIVSLALDTPSVLEVLTRQLPVELQPRQSLSFVVCPAQGLRLDALSGVQSRICARTDDPRAANHYCSVYLFLE